MSIPALTAIFDELNKIYDKLCDQSSLLSISGANAVFGEDGDKVAISISYDNLDTPAVPAVEAIIGVQFIDFQTWLTDLIANAPLPPPPTPPPSKDCEILKCCERVSEINNLLASLNNVADSPDKLSQRISGVILSIKSLLEEVLIEGSAAFTSPKIWDEKGKLNVNPNTAKFVFANANNNPAIDGIEEEVNDFYQNIISAVNKALVKEVPPS